MAQNQGKRHMRAETGIGAACGANGETVQSLEFLSCYRCAVIAGGRDTLRALMSRGIVRADGREFVGRAADGAEVSLGDDRAAIVYLAARPNPDRW